MRLSPRGMGVRITNASGTLTGVRSLCSRSGLVLIPARKRKVRDCPVLTRPKRANGIPILRMRLSPRGMGVRITNASGTSTGVRSLCSRSGLVLIPARKREVRDCLFYLRPNRANRNTDPSHAIGPRGMGVRITNASGTLTGVRSLCSRSGPVLIPARKRKVRDCPFLTPA